MNLKSALLAVESRPDLRPIAELGAQLVAWSELEARPRALVGADRSLSWCNRAASEFLAGGRDLVLRGGLVELLDSRKTEAFTSFLAAATPVMSSWCLGCGDGDGEILFRAWRVSEPGAPAVVGLVFHPTGAAFTPRWADFQTIFKLTTSEAQVTRLLLEGLTAERIAERLGVSVETVRSHIRRAYTKTGVSSREEIFRRMAPYRLV